LGAVESSRFVLSELGRNASKKKKFQKTIQLKIQQKRIIFQKHHR
jgi:hypothetical protein